MNAPSLVWTKDVEAFLQHVEISRESSCWNWTRAKNEWGYGHFTRDKKRMLAHRWVFAAMYGPIADGVIICHRCDNPACVNPAHLYEGTPKSNMEDMMARGRGKHWRRCGEQHPRSRLSASQVMEIADESRWGAMSQREVGEIYGVTQAAVSDIRTRRRWGHLWEVKP